MLQSYADSWDLTQQVYSTCILCSCFSFLVEQVTVYPHYFVAHLCLSELLFCSITDARVLPSKLFVGEGSVYLEEVDCLRDDSSLLECHNHGVLGFHECGRQAIEAGSFEDLHDHDASIACEGERRQFGMLLGLGFIECRVLSGLLITLILS